MKGTAPSMSSEERILTTIACHSAVKLGDKLSYEEMRALIKDLLMSRYPATCPHGRSICYRIDHKDIARKLCRAPGPVLYFGPVRARHVRFACP
jgi:DNA mismatch repair protein MutL